ncbi:sulfate adenylyltransferase subunit CysN [Asticcacaulis endophyticus]|uniref:Multifunctional fusion protein n=1 Tax=Asticcacaulis endophyticus TaxID=1395890 RepID=A0A918UMS2_9CAUL|nr:sulfate adenylyltransferase subunit CysN [Asticcacaulis endophyticus]GGZ21406.1 adenylyl-sulfate kinase [Asticcacaulis endophyticus]
MSLETATLTADAAPKTATLEKSLLRFLTCGSVDDGKSTLIGRLLYDTKLIFDDQLQSLERDSKKHGTTGEDIDFALLVDGLEAERQQGITIDVAYRFFSTPKRSFIVADTPGHEQYTRNMATGASNADLAIILIDARKGVLPQTRRHSFIASMLGIKHVVVAVNKIDLVDYDQARFEEILTAYREFADQLGFTSVQAIPLSARFGENMITRSGLMPWYDGPCLLEHLEAVDVESVDAQKPFRMGVQWVNRPNLDFRGFSGTIHSGVIKPGDELVVAGSGKSSVLKRIVTADGDLSEARAGTAVTLVLNDEIDVARGDTFAHPQGRPEVSDSFAAHILWMTDEALQVDRPYLIKLGHNYIPARVTRIEHKININTLEHEGAHKLDLNEIGLCHVRLSSQTAFDAYELNRHTGSFILIDRFTNATAGAGMITQGLNRATHVHRQELTVGKAARQELNGHKSAALWLTGLSGSGKSTIANLVVSELHARGIRTMMLDGDNIRHGLNKDLGFTDADRVENIRRVGEVAKLFVDAGTVVLCSFISPFASDRQMVRDLFEDGEFFEVFIDTPIEDCINRDPKGLYAKALKGEIKNFTGLDSPYEAPTNAEIVVKTERMTAAEAAGQIIERLRASDLFSMYDGDWSI